MYLTCDYNKIVAAVVEQLYSGDLTWFLPKVEVHSNSDPILGFSNNNLLANNFFFLLSP